MLTTWSNIRLYFGYRTIRKAVHDKGLNKQLPRTHPLIVMYANTLRMSQGEASSTADNYIANVSRVLMFIHTHIVNTKKNGPRHWSELVSGDVTPIADYIDK